MDCNCGKTNTIRYRAVLASGATETFNSIAEANAWGDSQGQRVSAITAIDAKRAGAR